MENGQRYPCSQVVQQTDNQQLPSHFFTSHICKRFLKKLYSSTYIISLQENNLITNNQSGFSPGDLFSARNLLKL